MLSRVSRSGVLGIVLLDSMVVGCGGSSSPDPGTPPGGTSSSSSSVSSSSPSSSAGSSSSSSSVASGTPTDHVTYRHDAGRTGLNPTESVLTPANVRSAGFGLVRQLPVDGKVDAQPLYLSHLAIAGGTHNVVFVATESDSVYAFDADSGAQLWQRSLVPAGETASDDRGCPQVTPKIGITATPVIDRAAGAIYLVAMTKDGADAYHHRLHALDITTGRDLATPTQITGSHPRNGTSALTFAPDAYEDRAALLLSHGTIYTTFSSHCDRAPYSGWVMAYDQGTLAQKAVISLGPSNRGPGIWMSGNGPAADASGNVYLLTGNLTGDGSFSTTLDADGFLSGGDYGNSFVRLTLSGSTLAMSDYFTVRDSATASANDIDLGSGGGMLLPDQTDASGTVRHLAIGAGKDHAIYVVDRDSMGHFSAAANNIWQELVGAMPDKVYATPSYFNGTIYLGAMTGTVRAHVLDRAKLSSAPRSETAATFEYPGPFTAVSANGTTNGIVWLHQSFNPYVSPQAPAVLHAYDAGDLSVELYNSTQAAGNRDRFGTGGKYITPMIADGKVFIGTQDSVAIFGLLP